MHSSISSFDYKRRALAVLALTLIFYLAANILMFKWDSYVKLTRENHHYYSEDKSSKNKLMNYLYSDASPDVIFVGNSMTREHIDTHYFRSKGIKVFNYGIKGYTFTQYPTMFKYAMAAKPKVIAFTINQAELFVPLNLFYEAYSHGDITLYDINILRKYAAGPEGQKYLKNIVGEYLYSFNYFKNRGYKIAEALKYFYYKPLGPYRSEDLPNDDAMITLNHECDLTDKNEFELECNNGDAMMLGYSKKLTYDTYGKVIEHSTEALNLEVIAMLNGYFKEIQDKGIRPVLILMPSFAYHKSDMKFIKSLLHVDIIDFSELKMAKDSWFDIEHFNTKGRRIYSVLLEKEMAKYVVS